MTWYEDILSKFMDGTISRGPFDFRKVREALQKDLNKLDGCVIANHKKF